MNKLDALKFFCTAADTLNFREAAIQLAVSPSVVTRTIAELEEMLGHQLFKRNTRSIHLTSFGEQFFPQAKKLLDESNELFALAKEPDEMVGVVRITLPRLDKHEEILYELLCELAVYPQLMIDWRVDMLKLNNVQHQIDIGIRIGREPNPNFIIKKIAQSQHMFVAAPELVARLGKPKNLEDLRQRYPFSGLLNPATGRVWNLALSEHESFIPNHVTFFTTDVYAEIQSALAGRTVVQSSNIACKRYLEEGRLIQLLPDVPQETWQLYLYRPYQAVTAKSVLKVFGILENILKKYYPN